MPEIVFNTRGADSIDKVHDRADARAKKTQKNYQQTAREAQNLGRIEQRIIRDTETARERYNRKLNETRQALAGHARETELVRRAETALKLEYARSTDANKKLLEQRKAAAKEAIAEQKKLTKVAQETTTEHEAAGGVLKGLATKALAYGGAFVSVQTAVRAITAELQAQQSIIDARVQTQLTVSEARNRLLRNVDPKDAAGVLKSATDIANETGLSEVAVLGGLEAAVSSTSGNIPLSTKLVRTASKYLRDRPGDIGGFSGTMADLTRVTQSESPEVQLGLLKRIGGLSRITSAELQAKNIAPALIGMREFGGDARTGGALFAALTTGGADVTGERTGTASIQLAAQLAEAAEGEKAFAKTDAFKGLSGLDLRRRITALQSDPELAQAFLSKASFEKKVLGPIRALLLDPSSAVASDFAANLDKIPGNQGLAKIGQETMQMFQQYNALEPVAERGRRLGRAVEGLQTRRAEDRLSVTELEQLRTIALETGSTSLGAKFTEFRDRATGGLGVSVGEAIEQIESRLDELEHPTRRDIFAPSQSNLGAFGDVPREPTEEEREAAEILREQVEALKNSVDEQKKTRDQTTRLMEENNRLLAQLARKPFGLVAGPG